MSEKPKEYQEIVQDQVEKVVDVAVNGIGDAVKDTLIAFVGGPFVVMLIMVFSLAACSVFDLP